VSNESFVFVCDGVSRSTGVFFYSSVSHSNYAACDILHVARAGKSHGIMIMHSFFQEALDQQRVSVKRRGAGAMAGWQVKCKGKRKGPVIHIAYI
jgi:hypothetical protein